MTRIGAIAAAVLLASCGFPRAAVGRPDAVRLLVPGARVRSAGDYGNLAAAGLEVEPGDKTVIYLSDSRAHPPADLGTAETLILELTGPLHDRFQLPCPEMRAYWTRGRPYEVLQADPVWGRVEFLPPKDGDPTTVVRLRLMGWPRIPGTRERRGQEWRLEGEFRLEPRTVDSARSLRKM